jgi:superfamily II DNA or RNA helicase
MIKHSTAEQNLLPSLTSGFINYTNPSLTAYRPSLVLNNPPQSKVIHTLNRELASCTSFEFSVAFITTGGIMMLIQALYEAQLRGVKGKILTSDYLGFTEPTALKLLIEKFPSIEVKMYRGDPFHAKGYIFHHGEEYSSIIIGSSNITESALAKNREWNIRLVSLDQGEILRSTRVEFLQAWEKAYEVSPALIIQYEKLRQELKQKRDSIPSILPDEEEYFDAKQITANIMQREALSSLENLRQRGEKKAIIISATGSGKTFLSAFDVKRYAPRKFLFIVHRQQIARESMHKFKQILSNSISTTLLGGGNAYNRDAIYTFAMIQTLSQDDTLYSFARDEFDYIVIDEVHRAGAASYEKVLSHFTPDFLLGMTATPERTDGYDIYRLFDHNIAYEIRLNEALEADLLCPFHYYGISDLSIEETRYEDLSLFAHLSNDQQVKQIVKAIGRYTVPGIKRRGLIFVSRNNDASILSDNLNRLGLSTLALSGADSDDTRNDAFDRLERGELEYLIAVDILNEGIDIPSLNQIIMLRPTQSAIIFVQQMGRGLRKYRGKKFLTVIDFIGNYQNNYLIPIALFGNTSYKKDALRKLVSTGSLGIHGVSTVDFDRVAKERIYKSINDTSFKTLKLLKAEYNRVKAKIGKIPCMRDFITHGVISPLLFIEYTKNFYSFKEKVEKPFKIELSEEHLRSLNFLSHIIAPGIRPYEALIIEQLIENDTPITYMDLKEKVQQRYNFNLSQATLNSAIRILTNEFYPEAMKKSYGQISYCEKTKDNLFISDRFKNLLQNATYRAEVEDILFVGKHEYKTAILPKRLKEDLILYHKYSREDVCRLLLWSRDEHATIYGYKVHRETMTCPIFVTYHKKTEEIDPSIDYEDHFISTEEFAWETRTRVRLNSKEPRAIRGEEGPLRKLLFIQKNNDEGNTFYYMGEVDFLSNTQRSKQNGKGEKLPVVAVKFALKHPVPPDLYEYIEG